MIKESIKNVAYRADLKKPQNPERSFDDRTREADIGDIILNENNIEFRAVGKPALIIDNIRNVVETSILGNKRIDIQYGTGLAPRTAYLFVAAANWWGRKYHESLLNHAQGLVTATSAASSPEGEAQIQAIHRVSDYAAQFAGHGQSFAKQLANLGIGSKDIEIMLQALDDFAKPAKAGQRNMLFGALWFIGGSAITFFTYQSASDGGSYFVFYGAIIFGFFQALAGFFQFISASRGQSALARHLAQAVLQNIQPEDAELWQKAARKL
jgi:hypothetical protein